MTRSRARHPWEAPDRTCQYATSAINLIERHLNELAEQDTPEASGAADILQALTQMLPYFFNAQHTRDWLHDHLLRIPECPPASAPHLARLRLAAVVRRLDGKQ